MVIVVSHMTTQTRLLVCLSPSVDDEASLSLRLDLDPIICTYVYMCV